MKPTPISDEIRAMIDLRHSAERRGHFTPLGRLLWMNTQHGMMRWPAEDGEEIGPDLARATIPPNTCLNDIDSDYDTLLLLGPWSGLPPVRVNTDQPCPRCRATCNVCGGSKRKLCELCGGAAFVLGNWLPCPEFGCNQETGNFNPGCERCRGTGHIREQLPCEMCGSKKDNDGFSRMICPACKGSGKISTGRAGGSTNWEGPKCKACTGTCRRGSFQKQDARKFTNAQLISRGEKNCKGKWMTLGPDGLKHGQRQMRWLVLGPIHSFAVRDFDSGRPRVFDVTADKAGDYLVLLVPALPTQRPYKAYLVGGVVQEVKAERLSA